MARLRWRNEVYDPFVEIDRLHDEINELFEAPRFPNVRGLFDRSASPSVDVTEDAEQYEVSCDVPGLKHEEVEVTLAQGVLTIKGEKKPSKRSDKTRVFRDETWGGKFQRTISLPGDVDPAKVTADLHDGVLTVSLPKREEAKPKQIAIQAK
jgi:HSP20 family protein